MGRAYRDANQVTTVLGVSNVDGITPIEVWVDPVTHRLLVDSNASGGGSSGTQYTEGDTDASITGTAVMWEDASDTLRAVSAAKPLPVSVKDSALPTGAATETTVGTRLSESDFDTKVGSLTETAPATDTASSGLNGRLQRIAQRITSLIALLPSALTGSGNFKAAIVESTATVQVQSNSANIATETTVGTRLSESDFDTKVGSLTESAPASDTASSGLNGRLQRIAQRITSLIALVPSALTGSGNFKVSLQESNATQAATQSGTWTVQPGNTQNTTAWLVTDVPATSGGWTPATGSIGATKTDIKTSAGQVGGWYIYNPNSSVAYVQFFNATAANVTLGTTAPYYSLPIPATSAANLEVGKGIAHSTAISIAVTTTRAGSTGPGSTVDYNIFYK